MREGRDEKISILYYVQLCALVFTWLNLVQAANALLSSYCVLIIRLRVIDCNVNSKIHCVKS